VDRRAGSGKAPLSDDKQAGRSGRTQSQTEEPRDEGVAKYGTPAVDGSLVAQQQREARVSYPKEKDIACGGWHLPTKPDCGEHREQGCWAKGSVDNPIELRPPGHTDDSDENAGKSKRSLEEKLARFGAIVEVIKASNAREASNAK
jgi:hypothetical protein